MNFATLKEIIIKELKSYFDHVGGYALLAIFLGILYFLFLRTFFLVQSASLRGLFELFPWLFALLVSAVTMGTFAQERDKQTLEYLFTKPISTMELLIGKILGSAFISFIAVLLTLPLLFFIRQLGAVDLGEAFAGYLGSFFLILSLTSLGVMVSSFFKNQITAFIATAVTIALLNIISTQFTAINLPQTIALFLSQLSVADHFTSVTRGVLLVTDVVYFAVFLLVTGSIAYLNLMRERITNIKEVTRKALYAIGITLIVASGIIYSTKYVSGRVDLTSSRKYTLSPATTAILREPGKVSITVYATDGMPQQFQVLLTELRNTLSDYARVGGGSVSVTYANPEDNKGELVAQNINPVQFNIVEKDAYQVKQGYLAVVIANEAGDKKEAIPFVQDINNLEYDLTSKINTVKSTTKPVIGFAQNSGEYALFTDLTTLQKLLSDQYDIEPVTLGTAPTDPTVKDAPKPAEPTYDLTKYALVVLANPTTPYSDKVKKDLNAYLDNGGHIFYLADPIGDIDTQSLTAKKAEPTLGDLFKDRGAVVNADLVYDLQSNVPVSIQQPGFPFPLQFAYPLFARAIKSTENSVSVSPQAIVMPWTSSVTLSKDGWKKLYETSAKSGAFTDTFNIDFKQKFPQDKLEQRVLMALLKLDKGILVVSGNGRILTDDNIQGSQENMQFVLGMTEFLAQGKGLTEIRAKKLLASQFDLVTDMQKEQVRFAGPGISFIILGGIGIWRFTRKRKLAKFYA